MLGEKRTVAIYDGLDRVHVWDVPLRRTVGDPLVGHTGKINRIAFSPDGRFLASGSDDRSVRLYALVH
ncbi:WD40 repeat domain-containing protein [Micromonospora sp. NPDC049523]|uniref:WD40 repeat domain-containing protein n=1 Tax=Micromonospora sp. NPDC049523 TaxID=3155921 RepID=UPI003441686C